LAADNTLDALMKRYCALEIPFELALTSGFFEENNIFDNIVTFVIDDSSFPVLFNTDSHNLTFEWEMRTVVYHAFILVSTQHDYTKEILTLFTLNFCPF
jgi:hypothetical protein